MKVSLLKSTCVAFRHHSRHVVHASVDDKTPKETNNSRSLLSLFCPLLKAFSSTNLRSSRPRWIEVSTSGLASITRLPFGSNASSQFLTRQDPLQSLKLFEFESCPFCRRVREALTDLDLSVEVYPCPKDAQFNRQKVLSLGGKEQFPFLVDENQEVQIYESEEIVRHLYKYYGMDELPPKGMLETTPLTGWMPTVLRIGRGMMKCQKTKLDSDSMELLQLFNYENNQFSRLVRLVRFPLLLNMVFKVREVLCELELPYRCISCGKGSKNREALMELQGMVFELESSRIECFRKYSSPVPGGSKHRDSVRRLREDH